MARPKNFYAVARFSVQDVLAQRPEWTAKQAREFLNTNEDTIANAMIQTGTQTIEDLLTTAAE